MFRMDKAYELLKAAKNWLRKKGMEHLSDSVVVIGDEAQVRGAAHGADFPVCGYKGDRITYYC